MKFLDLTGLTYFLEKVKAWVNGSYLSLIGGTIRGSVSFLRQGEGGSSIVVSPSSITKSGHDNHYLFASGKMIPIGEANGVAGLDANGNVPLAQLGNLDTTVAEVVTALPTTNIKKHIYLIEDEDGDTQNQYKEYIYTGDTSATYDASKWEKLGDFRATVDLADYAKTADVNAALAKKVDVVSGKGLSTNDFTAAYKSKLDKIGLTTDSIDLDYVYTFKFGYPDVTHGTGEVSINFKSADKQDCEITIYGAETDSAGVMSAEDKTKLDGISSGATADSAITTGEIDALFA